MKKIIFFLMLLLFPVITNASVIVMDADTKRVLYANNINEEKLIASTTKILTALIVLENTNLNSKIKVSDIVLKSYGSGIYIEIGEEMTVLDMLYGLMLRSGNDAALMLSEYTAGSVSNFVNMMNEYALNIGMKHSNFINPSGLEDEFGNGNTSTAYDMALLMAHAKKNDMFMKIIGTKKRIVKTNYKTYEWHNKNKLLSSYKYCIGGKTGFTKKARRTLVTIGSKQNKNLIVVTLNENDDFNLHKNLYETYFKKYSLVPIIDKNLFLPTQNYYVKESFSMLLTEKEKKNVGITLTYTDDLIKRAGYVTVSLNGKEYYKENFYENKKTSFKKKFFQFVKSIF